VAIILSDCPRHWRLTEVDAKEGAPYYECPSLFMEEDPVLGSGQNLRIFMERAQLRELRDLLNRAPLGDDEEYDIVYAATVLAWEAIGVS
jgi:hypothetical protein